MKKLFFTKVLLIVCFSSFSQIFVEGVVKENIYYSPIKGIEIIYNNETTFSDIEGKFIIQIESLPTKLFFNSPLFFEKYIEIKDEKKLEIILTNKGSVLEEIIVKSEINKKKIKNTASSISIIKDIETRKISDISIESGLNEIPGIYMHTGSLNTNRITIRGMGSRSPYSTNKIKSYINNIPLSNGVGETTIEDLGINLFNQIEIIKGPNSSIYGAGLGGGILLNLEKSKEHSLSYSSFFGSYNTTKNEINLYKKIKKVDFQINFQNLSSDGYRDNNNYIRNNAFGYLGYSLNDKIKLDFIYNFINLDSEIPSSLNIDDFNLNPSKAAENWKNVNGNENYKKNLSAISFDFNSSNYNLIANIFHNGYRSDEKRPFNFLKETSNGFGSRVVNTITKVNQKFNFGFEFFRENYLWKTFDNYGTDSEKILNDQNEQRNNLLVFSKYEIQIKNTINMTFGLSSNNINYRWETIEYNDLDPQSLKSKDSKKYKYQNIISPKISLNKTISNQNLFFTISHGYSPPNIDETLDDKGLVNQNIKPESGWNYELGIRGNLVNGKVSYDINMYLMKIKNLLVAQRTSEDTYVGVNAGKTSHPGIELSINSFIWNSLDNKKNITSEVFFSKNWHKFIEFVNEGNVYSNNYLTGVPLHTLNKNIIFKINKFKGTINYQKTGKIPINDSNSEYSEPYMLWNFKVAKLFKINKINLNIITGVKNLFDEKYASMILINAKGFGGKKPRYYYPGLPRNYFISLNIKV